MKFRVLTWQQFWAKRSKMKMSRLPYPVRLGIDTDSQEFESENREWSSNWMKPNNEKELWEVMG